MSGFNDRNVPGRAESIYGRAILFQDQVVVEQKDRLCARGLPRGYLITYFAKWVALPLRVGGPVPMGCQEDGWPIRAIASSNARYRGARYAEVITRGQRRGSATAHGQGSAVQT